MTIKTQLSRLILLVLTGLLVSACDIKVDAPFLPNVGAKAKDGSGESLTNESKESTNNETKELLINMTIDSSVETALPLKKELNCVQIIELPTGGIAIDYAAEPCPANEKLVSAASIKFTSSFAKIADGIYELTYQQTPIGIMEITNDGYSVTLKKLCSDSYNSYCYLYTSEEKFVSAPAPL